MHVQVYKLHGLHNKYWVTCISAAVSYMQSCAYVGMATSSGNDCEHLLLLCLRKTEHVSANWKFLGLLLGLRKSHLDEIERDRQYARDCRMEMLDIWLKGNPDNPETQLDDALKELCQGLKSKKCTCSSTNNSMCTLVLCQYSYVLLDEDTCINSPTACKLFFLVAYVKIQLLQHILGFIK